MNDELENIMRELLHIDSFFEKLKKSWKLHTIKKSEVDMMKQTLIKEAKPIYSNWAIRDDADEIDRLTITLFNKRITSLPNSAIISLYEDWQRLKNAKSKEAKELLIINFLTNMDLCYSLNGWFINRLYEEVRAGRLNKFKLFKRLIKV